MNAYFDFGQKTIYFITGASGVGKTALVEELRMKYRDKPWAFIHFDSIEIPSLADMEKEFGSPAAWQKAKTFDWIDELVRDCASEKIFFEGQVNLQFIRDGFARHNFQNYRIILIDCDEEVMKHRLTFVRLQPELYTGDMRKWLRYLRIQATETGTTILDSSKLSPEGLVREFEKATGL